MLEANKGSGESVTRGRFWGIFFGGGQCIQAIFNEQRVSQVKILFQKHL